MDDEEIEDPARTLYRCGVSLEQTGGFGQAVAGDTGAQAEPRTRQERFLVGGGNTPAELALTNTLGYVESHRLRPLRFLLTPKGSDFVHAGLGGRINSKFNYANTRSLEFEWNTPSLNNLGKEKPDGRGNVEADFVKHLVSVSSEVIFNPNL